jgi:spore coat polysaccharide biosynthesis protein SpsF (cytidylyltransferase family)
LTSIGALIPIRLDSTRLPHKALLDIEGIPAVQRLVTQIVACGHVDRERIVICTTERPQDDALVSVAATLGVRLYRGNTDDLIDRMYHASLEHHLDVILQVDGDDICADPKYMAMCLESVLRENAEVACCGEGLPLGAASKAFRFTCLETIFKSYVPGQNDTGFGYYLTKSGMFNLAIIPVTNPQHVMPDLRLTLDYPEDLALFRSIFRELRVPGNIAIQLEEICALARSNPDFKRMNAGLDDGYWERTREIMSRHPLRLRVGGETVVLGLE